MGLIEDRHLYDASQPTPGIPNRLQNSGTQDVVHWTSQLLGNKVSDADFSDPFILIQMLAILAPSSVNLSYFSSDFAFSCDDLTRVTVEMLLQGLEAVGIVVDKDAVKSQLCADGGSCVLDLAVMIMDWHLQDEQNAEKPVNARTISSNPKDTGLKQPEKTTTIKHAAEETYEPSELSFIPTVRWLLRYICEESDDEEIGASYNALQELKLMRKIVEDDLRRLPETPILKALTHGALYTAACKLLFQDHSLNQWIESFLPQEARKIEWVVSETGFLDFLVKQGALDFQDSLKSCIGDMIRDSSPFYESIHANIMEVFMQQSICEVNVKCIMDHINKAFESVQFKPYPYDAEEGLLFWFEMCVRHASHVYKDEQTTQWLKNKQGCNELTAFLYDGVAVALTLLIYVQGFSLGDISFDAGVLENWKLIESRHEADKIPLPSWRFSEIARAGNLPSSDISPVQPASTSTKSVDEHRASSGLKWLPIDTELVIDEPTKEAPAKDTPSNFPLDIENPSPYEPGVSLASIDANTLTVLNPQNPPESFHNLDQVAETTDFLKQIDDAVQNLAASHDEEDTSQESRTCSTETSQMSTNDSISAKAKEETPPLPSKTQCPPLSETEHSAAMKLFALPDPLPKTPHTSTASQSATSKPKSDFWTQATNIGASAARSVHPIEEKKISSPVKKPASKSVPKPKSVKTSEAKETPDSSSSEIASAAEDGNQTKELAKKVIQHVTNMVQSLLDDTHPSPAQDRRRKLRAVQSHHKTDSDDKSSIASLPNLVGVFSPESSVAPISESCSSVSLPPLSQCSSVVSSTEESFEENAPLLETRNESDCAVDSSDDSPPNFNVSDLTMSDSASDEEGSGSGMLTQPPLIAARKSKSNSRKKSTVSKKAANCEGERGDWIDVSVRCNAVAGGAKGIRTLTKVRKLVRRLVRVPTQVSVDDSLKQDDVAAAEPASSAAETNAPLGHAQDGAVHEGPNLDAQSELELPKFKGLHVQPMIHASPSPVAFDLSLYANRRKSAKSPGKPVFASLREKSESKDLVHNWNDATEKELHLATSPSQLPVLLTGNIRRKTATNRQIIQNAINHVCLAGGVNHPTKLEAVERLANSTWKHHVIILKTPQNHTYAALGAWNTQAQTLETIHTTRLPNKSGFVSQRISESQIDKFFKYDCGGRRFREIPTGGFGLCVDAQAASAMFKLFKKKKDAPAQLHDTERGVARTQPLYQSQQQQQQQRVPAATERERESRQRVQEYVSRLDPSSEWEEREREREREREKQRERDAGRNGPAGGVGGGASDSFMEDMLLTLDSAFAPASNSFANSSRAPAKAALPAPKAPSKPSNAYAQPKSYQQSRSFNPASTSMEDDILATLNIIDRLDSTTPSGGLSTTPYSDPSATQKKAAGYSSIYNRNNNINNSSSNNYNNNNNNSSTSKPTPASTSTQKPFEFESPRSYSSPAISKPAPITTSAKAPYKPFEPPVSLPSPPVTPKYNRTTKQSLQKEYESALEQAKREHREQDQARKIELAKALYFKELPGSDDNNARSKSALSRSSGNKPITAAKNANDLAYGRSRSSQGVRFTASSDNSDDSEDSDTSSDNRALGQLIPNRSTSAMGMVNSAGNRAVNVNGMQGRSLTAGTLLPGSGIGGAISKLTPGWLGQGRGVTPQKSSSALDIHGWVNSQQPDVQAPEQPHLGQRRSRMSLKQAAGIRPTSMLEAHKSTTPGVMFTRQTSQEGPKPPPLNPRTSQTFEKQNIQTNVTAVAPPARVISPLNPSRPDQAPVPPARKLGAANAATLQQLYQANQVKVLSETQHSQAEQQSAMMNYLTQMAIVQQTQMAALLAQQQQQQQQQQLNTSVGVVVGLAPSLKTNPVGMAVLGNMADGGKKKKKVKKVAFSDSTVDMTEFDSMRSGESGSGGSAGGVETPGLVSSPVVAGNGKLSPIGASSLMAGRE
ncbi:Calmodulin-regulated spectrin-associated protein 2 [Chytriomyces hyalinus]|nr:Calmodulin-regulated spectrin-associated protein 2 [Chytriomyces hyalinus]